MAMLLTRSRRVQAASVCYTDAATCPQHTTRASVKNRSVPGSSPVTPGTALSRFRAIASAMSGNEARTVKASPQAPVPDPPFPGSV